MEHCDMLNACVENFDHYNWIYQKCICKSNHKQYMILIFMQNCYLFYGLMMIFQQFYEQINKDSLFLSYPIDIAVIMIVQGNIFGLIHYIFALVTLFWNNVFTIIAFSAICRNLTQNELLNRQKYRYLYDTFVDYDQKIKTGFKNQHYKQYLQNLKNYLKQ